MYSVLLPTTRSHPMNSKDEAVCDTSFLRRPSMLTFRQMTSVSPAISPKPSADDSHLHEDLPEERVTTNL